MKIKSINFKKHNVFNKHTIIFGDINVPTISFLIGNNGSGKTKVLDSIHQLLSQPHSYNSDFEIEITIVFSDKEKTEFNLTENEIIYNVKKDKGNNTHSSKYLSGTEVSLNIQSLSKVVYSTIEVNFNEQNISSVTSKDIDDILTPKEKSQNLSIEIPQLLVDIKNLDDSDRGKWYESNKGNKNIDVPLNIGTRLHRFVSAFHKIYDGTKTFSDIKNESGSKKIIFIDTEGNEIGLNELSTGEKQIIYRVGYILKNLGTIDGGIILIDEPEISLHPIWQTKLKDFLLEVFKDFDIQIIVATHSPYIFKNLNEKNEVCIKIDRTKAESKKISLIFPNVPFNPSVNLINYLAYGIVSELLHIELYTLLQIREGRDKITNSYNRITNVVNQDGIENWLQDTSGGSMSVKQSFTRTGQSTQSEETIMTWIRNKIHHRNEPARPEYNENDLKESIDKMIEILQK
jgi:predicted ATP-dependent endonuclease of OLD family